MDETKCAFVFSDGDGCHASREEHIEHARWGHAFVAPAPRGEEKRLSIPEDEYMGKVIPVYSRRWNQLCPAHGTTSLAVGTGCICESVYTPAKEAQLPGEAKPNTAPSAEEVVLHRYKAMLNGKQIGWSLWMESRDCDDECAHFEHVTVTIPTATIRRK